MHLVGMSASLIARGATFPKPKHFFMIANKIFYADAQHHVIVTDSTFVVKNKEYHITGIRNHDIKEVKPVVPGVILATAGSFLTLAGLFHLVSFRFIPEATLMNVTIGGYGWTIAVGVFLMLAGSIMMMMVKTQYALHISTAEGENDVLVSPKREYIKQITDALNRAFMLTKK
jgi:hypothetical protein